MDSRQDVHRTSGFLRSSSHRVCGASLERPAMRAISGPASGLGAIALSSYLLAPAFARLSRRSVVAGCAFGVLVCALGALAFGFSAALVYPDFSVRAFVWRPFFWFASCGFPVAAFTGLLFSGAAQRLSSPTQPHATNAA